MKKGLFASYFHGIVDRHHGERYSTIFRYFIPEFITAFVIYSLPFWIDSAFVGQLNSTATYATLGVTNSLIHFILKLAEALSVGTVVMSGQFNGQGDFEKAGRSMRDAFWVTCILGFTFGLSLYCGAGLIYRLYGVPDDMIHLGVPFLRLRAVGVFFTFVYMAFVGFLRGIKNVKVAMHIFLIGIAAFIFFDYVLIFGKFGFPKMELQGSAIASLIQYGLMLVLSIGYVLLNKEYRKYGIHLFAAFKDGAYALQLLSLSWPVVIDKALMAGAYVWLCAQMCPMGKCSIAAFNVIKDMERFAFLPAIAFAQVITFLVSNDYGKGNWEGIKSNIKKVMFISSIGVFTLLIGLSLFPAPVVKFFDSAGDFTDLASRAFPVVSVLVFFDLLQLVLAGALRGAGDVRTVMMTRLVVVVAYFMPFSYILARINMQDAVFKFILVYGSFYLGNALMSIVYIRRLRGEAWKKFSPVQE